MPVDGISTYGNTPNYQRNNVAASSNSLTITDFYKLLAAQLQYQDADNPMDTSEMMAQMVQSQMISAIMEMSNVNMEMASVNMNTYASSMVGKEVTMAELDSEGKYTGENTTGTVTSCVLGEPAILYIGDKGYHLSQLMSVGKLVTPPEEGGETEQNPAT